MLAVHGLFKDFYVLLEREGASRTSARPTSAAARAIASKWRKRPPPSAPHDVKRDGSNPALLYAYGSYGSSEEAEFSSNLFSLVDRGVVYAVAYIRGGGELGKKWHDEGRMLNKKNTFTDFEPPRLRDQHGSGRARGKSGRSERLRERAFDYAFILWQLSVETPATR